MDPGTENVQQQIYSLYSTYSEVFFYFIVVIAVWEIGARIFYKRLSWRYVLDTVSSLVTLPVIAYMGVAAAFIGIGSISDFEPLMYEQYAAFQLGWSWWSLAIVLLITDFWYYWTHRAFHRINIMWTTHTVHHSSDYINIPMAYRFGPLDAFFVALTHFPLVFFFPPELVGIGIIANQIYQAWIHTDRIKKMPNWFEAVFNTPSHHRVHHGSNPQYTDKNYAGVLIIWDKWFGTFEPEVEEVKYGITKPLKYQDPITVLFHGFWRFAKKLSTARSPVELLFCFVKPPGWQTRLERERQAPLEGLPVAQDPAIKSLGV